MALFERREFPEINRIGYEITDDYGHTAQLSPKELLQLLVYLQDFEQQIIADAQENREVEAMQERGYSDAEITHAREVQQYGSTDITELIKQKLEESEE